MDNDMKASETATMLAAGAALSGPMDTDVLIPYAVVPKGYELQSLEPRLAAPVRWRTDIEVFDVASMVDYLTLFKATSSRIYYQATKQGASFLAIVNDHDVNLPGVASSPTWRDHRVGYKCPFSVEFLLWIASNGKEMTHLEFATFIEENQLDVTLPPSAEMLEISRSMRAKKQVDWISDKTLSNGSVSLTYSEQVQGTAGPNGNVRIPDEIELTIPIFVNGNRATVRAKLRYKLASGSLRIWYSIVQPHVVIRNAVDDVVQQLRKLELPILHGVPGD